MVFDSLWYINSIFAPVNIVMRSKNLIFLLLVCTSPFSYGQVKDTLHFDIFHESRHTHLWLGPGGIMSSSFTCDVCPVDETMGFYEMRNDTVLISYKLRFAYETRPHKDADTSISFMHWKDTLYYMHHETGDYICSDKNKFNYHIRRYNHTGNERELTDHFFKQAARKE